VGLAEVADWHNLAAAFHRAASGKRRRPDVMAFGADLEAELAALRRCILAGEARLGPAKRFLIRDLGSLDRLLLEGCRVGGLVRYMDDLVWWGDTRAEVRDALAAACHHAAQRLRLVVKEPMLVGPRERGLPFCGYRIQPRRLLLSRRRKRRYIACRRHWERAYACGQIDAGALQRGFASALGITAHADAVAWRREQLRRTPVAAAVAEGVA
jgi:hypothetical protein